MYRDLNTYICCKEQRSCMPEWIRQIRVQDSDDLKQFHVLSVHEAAWELSH